MWGFRSCIIQGDRYGSVAINIHYPRFWFYTDGMISKTNRYIIMTAFQKLCWKIVWRFKQRGQPCLRWYFGCLKIKLCLHNVSRSPSPNSFNVILKQFIQGGLKVKLFNSSTSTALYSCCDYIEKIYGFYYYLWSL